MTCKNDISASFIARDDSTGSDSSAPEGCVIVDSAQRLMALGLSAVEIEELGIPESSLQALCEYARLDRASDCPPKELVDAALEMLKEETAKADLELEMLKMRRRALTKRAKLLHKLAAMLQPR